jgi:hypothetical protein
MGAPEFRPGSVTDSMDPGTWFLSLYPGFVRSRIVEEWPRRCDSE